MNSVKTLSFIVLASIFSSLHAGVAVMGAKQAPTVVVVQLQEVAQKSRWFMEIQKRVEAAVKKIVDEIKALEKQFNEKVEKLQAGGRDMNMVTQQKLQEELASLKGQMEVKQRNLQTYVEIEGQKAEKELVDKIRMICEKLGYDIVIPAAIYTKKEFDRTNEIIDQMDKGITATPAVFAKPAVSKATKVPTAASAA